MVKLRDQNSKKLKTSDNAVNNNDLSLNDQSSHYYTQNLEKKIMVHVRRRMISKPWVLIPLRKKSLILTTDKPMAP